MILAQELFILLKQIHPETGLLNEGPWEGGFALTFNPTQRVL